MLWSEAKALTSDGRRESRSGGRPRARLGGRLPSWRVSDWRAFASINRPPLKNSLLIYYQPTPLNFRGQAT